RAPASMAAAGRWRRLPRPAGSRWTAAAVRSRRCSKGQRGWQGGPRSLGPPTSRRVEYRIERRPGPIGPGFFFDVVWWGLALALLPLVSEAGGYQKRSGMDPRVEPEDDDGRLRKRGLARVSPPPPP